MTFGQFDLGPTTLTVKLDIDMVELYLCTENEVLRYSG